MQETFFFLSSSNGLRLTLVLDHVYLYCKYIQDFFGKDYAARVGKRYSR